MESGRTRWVAKKKKKKKAVTDVKVGYLYGVHEKVRARCSVLTAASAAAKPRSSGSDETTDAQQSFVRLQERAVTADA